MLSKLSKKYNTMFLRVIENGNNKGFIVYDNPDILDSLKKSVNSALSLRNSEYSVMLPKRLEYGKGFVLYPQGKIVISK